MALGVEVHFRMFDNIDKIHDLYLRHKDFLLDNMTDSNYAFNETMRSNNERFEICDL